MGGDGIESLRYDKLGTGKTGLASHVSANGVDFNILIDEARSAYDYLRSRPEIDPTRVMILGHSEGGMIGPDKLQPHEPMLQQRR